MEATITSPIISKSCRICLDNDDQNDLISPCLCKGGSAYVHRKCLDNWRSLNKAGRSFKYCDVCKFEYVIEPVIDDPVADKKRLLIFRLLVTRDITAIILLIQLIIVGMTFLLQFADKKNHVIKDLYPHSMSSFGMYYLSSIVLFFAFLGFFGLIGFCCGCTSDRNTRVANGDPYCEDCPCYPYTCVCVNCNGCNGNSNCSGDCGEGGAIVVLVIIVVFAGIGLFVGIILTGVIVNKIMKHHTNKLWLRQEAKKYVVKDFQERMHELPIPTISTQNTASTSEIHNAYELHSMQTKIWTST